MEELLETEVEITGEKDKEPEKLPEYPPFPPIPSGPPIQDRRPFFLGIAVGAAAMALLAAVAFFLILINREPEIETVTVRETVYVPVQATDPTLPPPEKNHLGPEDFTYNEKGFLTCTAQPSMLGIDVSTYQKEVDWEQVRAAGVEFVMLRAGLRGYGRAGVMEEDAMVRTHYAGATAAGLKVGFYFFSQATTPAEALEEAELTLSIIGDWQVDMPIVYDWEYVEQGRAANLTPRQVTDCTIAFCQRIREAGFDAMIYFNADQSRDNMLLEELTDYPFWLAMYNGGEMNYEYRIDMWQYTETGSVPGIPGSVDINLYFPPV